jgi:L,D-peptidoglycan transpeptidase YkuD (ErfK/YbiS/YcfS/YnhG family)
LTSGGGTIPCPLLPYRKDSGLINCPRGVLMAGRLRRRLIILLSVAIVFCAILLLVVRQFRNPPTDKFSLALDAVSRAHELQAELYAESVLKQAEICLHNGEKALDRENSRWLPFWSYYRADSLFGEAVRLAEKAARMSQARLSNKHHKVESDIALLSDSLSAWRALLDANLTRIDCEKLWRTAQAQLSLASSLLARDCDEAAEAYSDSVRLQFQMLSEKEHGYTENVKKQSRALQKWAAETRRHSLQTGEPAIIIDKSAHTLFVLKSGKVINSYPCDLGYNAAYQKRTAGDGATPEGMYHVTEIRYKSKYYRALLLNFPNEDDKKRFKENLRNGAIAPHSKIGGLIEIHGHGGQNKDWTNGCVAVADRHMDELMKIADVGMLVTIVRNWDQSQ